MHGHAVANFSLEYLLRGDHSDRSNQCRPSIYSFIPRYLNAMHFVMIMTPTKPQKPVRVQVRDRMLSFNPAFRNHLDYGRKGLSHWSAVSNCSITDELTIVFKI